MQFKLVKSFPASRSKNSSSPIVRTVLAAGKTKLATATADSTSVHMADLQQTPVPIYKDKFPTKSAKEPAVNYRITDMQFSSDESRLALSQSDGGLYVYKLGNQWGDKKSICNKFIVQSSICRFVMNDQIVLFACVDGKLYVGHLKSNKSVLAYEVDDGSSFLALYSNSSTLYASCVDGNVYRFSINGSQVAFDRIFYHSVVPITALCCDNSSLSGSSGAGVVTLCGSDKRIIIMNRAGQHLDEFDYGSAESGKFYASEFTHCFYANGVTVALCKDTMIVIKSENNKFVDNVQPLDNLSVITSIAYNSPFLYMANIGANVVAFETFSTKVRCGNYFITQAANSCLISPVIPEGDAKEVVLDSEYDFVYGQVAHDRFVIAFTSSTLIIHDIRHGAKSEISWVRNGQEKFYFGHAGYVVVYLFEEANIVHIGENTVRFSIHTSNVTVGKMSLSESAVAFANAGGVFIQSSSRAFHEISHPMPVDHVNLSFDSNFLLFRDKSKSVYMYDINQRTKQSVYGNIGFFSWVPGCLVFVMQSYQEMLVCYTPTNPTSFSKQEVIGMIVRVEKHENRTRVVVDGTPVTYIPLDDSKTDFVAALASGQLRRAAYLLECIEADSSMWKILLKEALTAYDLLVIERCYAGMLDIAGVRFIASLRKTCKELESQGIIDPENHYSVRAKFALLQNQYKLAETLYLEQGRLQDAMQMYQEMHKWDESIQLAETRNHPNLETLKVNYFNWLVQSGQLEQAALIRQRQGRQLEAVDLYLKGGMPGKAVKTLLTYRLYEPELITRVSTSLINAGLFEQAGELFVAVENVKEAYDLFKKGKVYRQAIDLARRHFPQDVVRMEELWAEHLLSHRQMEAAVNHFLEANKIKKALEICSEAKLWRKLSSILESLEGDAEFESFFKLLGSHYEAGGDYARAEINYTKAGLMKENVRMFIDQKMWEKAWRCAVSGSSKEEASKLFTQHAAKLEQDGLLKDAEMVYLTVGDVDEAINMYKERKSYDNMIRLVSQNHRDLLAPTLKFIGGECEQDKNFREAERFYIESGEWKLAVAMYCNQSMYEDALRLAKSVGGSLAAKQVAYLWAKTLTADSAFKLLEKQGYFTGVVELALENKQYEFASSISSFGPKELHSEVLAKYGQSLEIEGKFKEAEDIYLRAGRPKDAISMYIKAQEWNAALSIAESHDNGVINDVLLSKGNACFQNQEYGIAEACFIRAQKPDLMIQLYTDNGMWDEAIRFAYENMPAKVADLQKMVDIASSSTGRNVSPTNNNSDMISIAKSFENKQEYDRAIDSYLKIGPKQVSSTAEIEAIWNRAIEIAYKFVPVRSEDVVRQVADRLLKLQQFAQAARLLVTIDSFQRAAEIFVMAEMWDDARTLASKNPSVAAFVDSAYRDHLKDGGHAEKLADVDVIAALDIFVERGQWQKCLEKSAQTNAEVLQQYLGIYCDQMQLSREYGKILETLSTYGPLQNARNGFYASLCKAILDKPALQQLTDLSNVLAKIKSPTDEIQKYSSALYLLSVRERIKYKVNLKGISLKLSLALLRYADILYADKLFYEAGEAAITAEDESTAFVCWNKYLDMEDALSDQHSTFSKLGSEFESSDLPNTWLLPSNGAHSVEEAKREQVRDWILAKSLDSKVSRHVPTRTCGQCSQSVLESTLRCPKCSKTHDMCIVSGYPILADPMQTPCKGKSIKDYWNMYIASEKKCPKCGDGH